MTFFIRFSHSSSSASGFSGVTFFMERQIQLYKFTDLTHLTVQTTDLARATTNE